MTLADRKLETMPLGQAATLLGVAADDTPVRLEHAIGAYTPGIIGIANIAASASAICNYVRFGDFVMVFGSVSITPTAISADTQLLIALPVASDIAAVTDLSGSAGTFRAQRGAQITGDVVNNMALLRFVAEQLLATTFTFQFGYRII